MKFSESTSMFMSSLKGETDLVLSQQEGQQHQHAAIVHHPPHVDGSLPQAVLIGGETVYVLGHQQSLMGRRALPHRLWRRSEREKMPSSSFQHQRGSNVHTFF